MPKTPDFDIFIDTRGLRLDQIEQAVENPEPILKLIAQRHVLNVDDNFKNEAGAEGPWKPLSLSYARWKARQPRAIQKKLQFSGLMRAGINYELGGDGRSVSVGSDKVYGPRHEATRPFLAPTSNQLEQFGDIAGDYIANL